MKAIRVVTAVVALLALPLIAVHAQGKGKGPRANSEVCASPAGNSGHVPYGQEKKCPPPPPPPPDPGPGLPPTGINMAMGTVFADLDANGSYSPFAGDTVIAGASVQLLWNGAVYQSAVTDANGVYQFSGLGSTDSPSWSVCVSVPAGVTQGPPPAGFTYNGCGGTGYSFAFPTSNTFGQGFTGDFGMLPL